LPARRQRAAARPAAPAVGGVGEHAPGHRPGRPPPGGQHLVDLLERPGRRCRAPPRRLGRARLGNGGDSAGPGERPPGTPRGPARLPIPPSLAWPASRQAPSRALARGSTVPPGGTPDGPEPPDDVEPRDSVTRLAP